MAVPVAKKRHTVLEYLAMEEHAVDRHEFHDGEILMMSGGSYNHSRVASNLIGMLYARLRGSPCEVLESNMRLKLAPSRRYVYPDAMIVCNGPQFDPDDRKKTTIENPRVVFEVLSDSTSGYDRGEKFYAYAQVESIETYVLLDQDAARVEIRTRQPQGDWRLLLTEGLEASIRLPGFAFELPLRDLYERVAFDDASAAAPT